MNGEFTQPRIRVAHAPLYGMLWFGSPVRRLYIVLAVVLGRRDK